MYKHSLFGPGVIRIADGACIPPDVHNPDYQDVLAWVAAGNVIAPSDPPPALDPIEQKLKDDTTAALAYQKLANLSNMSPQQIQTWVGQNVTNLAQAQDAICTLAIGLSVLFRRIK